MPENAVLTLVRHGRPDLSPWRWSRRSDFARFLLEFDSVPINPSWAPPDSVVDRVNAAGAVFSSTAARAVTSAELLLNDRSPISDPLFLEAPVAVPPLPLVLPLPAWTVLGRLMWMAGVRSALETPAQARVRAGAAAEVLAEAVRRHGSVALVGHGWFNRMIGVALLARGWRGKPSGGHGYWSHRGFFIP